MAQLEEATKRLQSALDRLEQVVDSRAADADEVDTAELRAALDAARREHAALQEVTVTVAKRLDATIARLKTAMEC